MKGMGPFDADLDLKAMDLKAMVAKNPKIMYVVSRARVQPIGPVVSSAFMPVPDFSI